MTPVVTSGSGYSDKQASSHKPIKGFCASACAMHLRYSCVEKNAVLFFHGPSGIGEPLSPEDYAAWVEFIATYYPKPLAEWYVTEGHKTETTMKTDQVVALGATPC